MMSLQEQTSLTTRHNFILLALSINKIVEFGDLKIQKSLKNLQCIINGPQFGMDFELVN